MPGFNSPSRNRENPPIRFIVNGYQEVKMIEYRPDNWVIFNTGETGSCYKFRLGGYGLTMSIDHIAAQLQEQGCKILMKIYKLRIICTVNIEDGLWHDKEVRLLHFKTKQSAETFGSEFMKKPIDELTEFEKFTWDGAQNKLSYTIKEIEILE